MKVLGSDFDNTLYFLNDEELTKKNVEAIKKFMSLGNIFFIITGRTYMEIEKDLKKTQVPYTYLVCGDGAMIFDENRNCIQRIKLSKEISKKAVEILKEEGYEPYFEDGFKITNKIEDCIKISAVYKNKKDAIKIAKRLNKELDVYAYASSAHVNINNSTNHKKLGVDRLISYAKLPKNKIHLIGDDVNDYEMLESYQGATLTKHNEKLDTLNIEKYETLYKYVEYLLNN